jgi:N-acetylneuraminate synthase
MKSKKEFAKIIKIGSRLVGEGQPTYFIADIGANFDGSLKKAKKVSLIS